MESSTGIGRREIILKYSDTNFIGNTCFFYSDYSFVGTVYNNYAHDVFQNVKDSFEIYISLPVNYAANKNYDVVYYCDANLKSGKELRQQITADDKLPKEGNFIFIGIGHIGNYHVLRRRDFILPFINNGDTVPKSAGYGHIKDFYSFLTTELIRLCNLRITAQRKEQSLVIHSAVFSRFTVCFKMIKHSPAISP